jgi:hypothetical protein
MLPQETGSLAGGQSCLGCAQDEFVSPRSQRDGLLADRGCLGQLVQLRA